jgi:hypothetical protein
MDSGKAFGAKRMEELCSRGGCISWPIKRVSAMNRTRRRDLKHVALAIAVEGSVPENLSRLMLVSFNRGKPFLNSSASAVCQHSKTYAQLSDCPEMTPTGWRLLDKYSRE